MVLGEVVGDADWMGRRSGKDCCLYFLLGGVFDASGAQAKRVVERERLGRVGLGCQCMPKAFGERFRAHNAKRTARLEFAHS